MKIFCSTKIDQAMTLIEVFVVLAVLSVLVAMLLPAMTKSSHCTFQSACASNLRQVGLAVRVWAGDNNDKYPMEISETNGGTRELSTGPNAWRHFQVMSNELSTPKVLFCPNEADPARIVATNWNINNSNLTYFVGVRANQTMPAMILSGDHCLTNGTRIKEGLLNVTTDQPTGWTVEVHEGIGDVLLGDGSLQQVKTAKLRTLVHHSGVATNRLQMPVLRP